MRHQTKRDRVRQGGGAAGHGTPGRDHARGRAQIVILRRRQPEAAFQRGGERGQQSQEALGGRRRLRGHDHGGSGGSSLRSAKRPVPHAGLTAKMF